MTDSVYKRSEDVVQREVAGETFLVPIRGRLADLQELFVLNEVGSWLWSRLDGSKGVGDLIAELVIDFEVSEEQARADAELFLGQLTEAGLAEEGLRTE